MNLATRISSCTSGDAVSQPADLKVNLDPSASSSPASPSFVLSPVGQSVLLGGDVTLECAANGVPQPGVSWLKDGRELDLGLLDTRYTRTGWGSLTIR